MTAALLRTELFHHLLASKPENTGRENARAGIVALAFHAALVLLLLQLPTQARPATDHTRTLPIILESISLAEYASASNAGGNTGSTGASTGPALLPVPDLSPDLRIIPAPPSYRPGDELRPINADHLLRSVGGGGGRSDAARVAGESGNFMVLQSAPRMLNAEEISVLLHREYPHRLMQAGIGGTVLLHVLIDPAGKVIEARLAQSSGVKALDDAALRVSREMQFSPAQNNESAIRVWAEIPVVFSARD